jgi:hypothetical protein
MPKGLLSVYARKLLVTLSSFPSKKRDSDHLEMVPVGGHATDNERVVTRHTLVSTVTTKRESMLKFACEFEFQH